MKSAFLKVDCIFGGGTNHDYDFPAAAGVRELHDDCKTGDEAGAA